MMACYIIYSTSLDRFYTVITQESMENRLEIHNKKMKSKMYIQNLKKYPEIVEKILIKNS